MKLQCDQAYMTNDFPKIKTFQSFLPQLITDLMIIIAVISIF